MRLQCRQNYRRQNTGKIAGEKYGKVLIMRKSICKIQHFRGNVVNFLTGVMKFSFQKKINSKLQKKRSKWSSGGFFMVFFPF